MTQIPDSLIDKDVQLALQRFGGNATAYEMLRWINHELRRGYQLQEFEDSLAKLKPFSGEPSRRTAA